MNYKFNTANQTSHVIKMKFTPRPHDDLFEAVKLMPEKIAEINRLRDLKMIKSNYSKTLKKFE